MAMLKFIVFLAVAIVCVFDITDADRHEVSEVIIHISGDSSPHHPSESDPPKHRHHHHSEPPKTEPPPEPLKIEPEPPATEPTSKPKRRHHHHHRTEAPITEPEPEPPATEPSSKPKRRHHHHHRTEAPITEPEPEPPATEPSSKPKRRHHHHHRTEAPITEPEPEPPATEPSSKPKRRHRHRNRTEAPIEIEIEPLAPESPPKPDSPSSGSHHKSKGCRAKKQPSSELASYLTSVSDSIIVKIDIYYHAALDEFDTIWKQIQEWYENRFNILNVIVESITDVVEVFLFPYAGLVEVVIDSSRKIWEDMVTFVLQLLQKEIS